MQTIAGRMGKGKPTIHDIARELNLTASTVSRALNGHRVISESTRLAVSEAAKRLNYKPNHIATALRSGRSHIIGVIVPAADRSFFASIIRGIEDEAGPAGYSVIVCQTYEETDKEKKILETLLRTQVDGILASIAKNALTFDHYRRVREEQIPLVLFDNTADSLEASAITVDDYAGAYRAVEHLIGQGCRRIAHFSGLQHIGLYRERLRGYCAALQDHGLPVDPALVITCSSDVEHGWAAAEKLLSLPAPPDALFSSSDYAALGAMQCFKERKIAVPGQIAIVGFANEPFTSYVEPALSTVDQDSYHMGRCAARSFLSEVRLTPDERSPQHVVLEPRLIVRASSSLKK